MMRHSGIRKQRGVTLVEVLVTLIILAIGLLGLVALHARVQVLQAESYQRAQALILLKDMAGRIANNRGEALLPTSPYVAGDMGSSGVGAHLPATQCEVPESGTPRSAVDLAEWCQALQGAAERLGDNAVGAMSGGRGCVQNLGGGRFLVTVAWQGLAPISAPPAGVGCGRQQYDSPAGTPCAPGQGEPEGRCRRAVTTIVQFAELT